jgi:hypothetical protein
LLALQEFLAKKTSEEEAVFCMVQEALGGTGITFIVVIYNHLIIM